MSELSKLIEAVEAGVWPGSDMHTALGTDRRGELAYDAYNGSLDAFKVLLDALLPGWDWTITDGVDGCTANVRPAHHPVRSGFVGVSFDVPARAGLLAVLKAHEAIR